MSNDTAYFVFAIVMTFAIGIVTGMTWNWILRRDLSGFDKVGVDGAEAENPRPWIVDGDGWWWLPCATGGYACVNDKRPPSAYSVDQIEAEAGIDRVVPGGPERRDAPVAAAADTTESALFVPVELVPPPMIPPRKVVEPPPGYRRESVGDAGSSGQ